MKAKKSMKNLLDQVTDNIDTNIDYIILCSQAGHSQHVTDNIDVHIILIHYIM